MNRGLLPLRKNCEGYFFNDKGEILAKEDNGLIIFPGGGIDNENVKTGMIRETLEETGFNVKIVGSLGQLKTVWGDTWAKTEKQKARYLKYKGDNMYFFFGKVLSCSSVEEVEDYWEGSKFMELKEVISKINSSSPFASDVKEYREQQLTFLNGFLDEDKLAILGGKKVVTRIHSHYSWPIISKRTEEAVKKQLYSNISIYDRSGIIEELEDKFCKIYGVKHALLTNSGTSALHSLFVAANLKEGDEVICPAYTFHATITPLFFTGAIPVLADCNADGNIDPLEIKKKISSKTKAIIITHMWGVPCDMDAIVKIAKENNLLLLEDCSHAHFAKYKGRFVGTFGDAAAFSIQGPKTVTGGEGGCLITNNDEVFHRALLLGHYNKRCKNEIPKDSEYYKYAVTGMGLKFRIHPIAAAIVYEQLESVEELVETRRIIASRLVEGLKGLKGIAIPDFEDKAPSWYAFTIQYVSAELDGLPFDTFYDALLAEGCCELDHPGSTGALNLLPLLQQPEKLFPNYDGKLNYTWGDMPHAESFYKNALKIPVWHDLDDLELVEEYIRAFRKVIKSHKALLKPKMLDETITELIKVSEEEGIQKLVVGAVIKREGKFLLLHRPSSDFMGGIYELPSGNLNPGEGLKEGTVREVKEETGLDVQDFKSYVGSFDYVSGSGKSVRQFNFLVEVSEGPVVLTEHDASCWATKDSAEYNRITSEVRNILEGC